MAGVWSEANVMHLAPNAPPPMRQPTTAGSFYFGSRYCMVWPTRAVSTKMCTQASRRPACTFLLPVFCACMNKIIFTTFPRPCIVNKHTPNRLGTTHTHAPQLSTHPSAPRPSTTNIHSSTCTHVIHDLDSVSGYLAGLHISLHSFTSAGLRLPSYWFLSVCIGSHMNSVRAYSSIKYNHTLTGVHPFLDRR